MVVDFCDYFWGEKNNGFDILYHNMKYGLVASKEIAEFLRERSSLEETYSKQLGKLAKQCGSSTSIAAANSANGAPNIGPLCTFTPLWQLLKTSCEKVAQLQLQMAQKLNEMVKDVGKYSDELARKHKIVKESESSTVEAIQTLNQTNVALLRSKEVYFQRGVELAKLRKESSTSNKDLERADTKFKKAAEEYRNLVEKYAQLREDFERKMTVSCRHFQEVEEGHLSQMRNFLNSYVNVLCNNYEAMGQVHVDLRQQWDDMSVDRLLDMFVVSKMTGMEKPLPAEFVEFPLDNEPQSGAQESQQLADYLEEIPVAPTSTAGKVKEGFLKSRRDRRKEKDKKVSKKKRDSDASSIKSDGEPSITSERERDRDKDEGLHSTSETVESLKVDDEGYSIRPKDDLWNTEKTSGFYSSSDGDSDDEPEKKLHVEIKPIANGSNQPSATVDELKATIGSLNINSSMFNTVARKNIDSYSTSQLSMGKSSSDLVGLNLFQSPTNSDTSTPVGGAPSYGTVVTPTAGEDLFDEVGEIVPTLPPKQGRLPAPNSRGSTPTLSSIAVPRPPSRKGYESTSRLTAASPLTLQTSPSPSFAATMSSAMPRADSVVSLEFRPGSVVSTSPTSLSRPCSRSAGPSPLTISVPSSGAVDSIPLAVAFQEVVHALFRGSDESRCQVRIGGDMLLSFPAGLIQLINSQPNSIPPISFRIKNFSSLESVIPNKLVLNMEYDLMSVEPLFNFNMPELAKLLKSQAEQNPSASYFNVDILKYQVKTKSGAGSAPLHLVSYWKCENSQTDVRLDYKFNAHAQITPAALRNLMISIPIEGAVTSMQAKPQGEWMENSNRALWKLPEMSMESEGANVGSIRARFSLTGDSGSPTTITAHFGCDGSTLSGAEMEMVSPGYRTSLVKRRFVAGKYLCETETDTRTRYAALPGPTSTEC